MEKMAPNRGRKAVRESILKVAALAVLVSVFNCINGQELEGIMNERDQALLRETADSLQHRKGDVPKGNDKSEASKSMPDSLPLTAVFSNSENTFMHLMDANRLTGVEPYQGDMLLDKVDKAQINQTREDEKARKSMNPKDYAKRMLQSGKRNMVRRAEKLWVSKIVPYEIDASRVAATSQIEEAFKELEELSCLKFRRKIPGDKNWIKIYRGVGCFSDIGRSYQPFNPTSLSLGNMCLTKSLILHETMHALGFFHEQSRMDRDSFVNIYNENVRSGMESNFEKIESYEADVHDTDYDFDSIMQYGNTAFSRNGEDTMRDKFDPNKPIGGKKLSNLDIIELNKAYQCHSKSKIWSDWSHWGPCEKDWSGNCVHHRQRYCFSEDQAKCGKADDYGVETLQEPCNATDCQTKFDGHWGNWGSWGACSKTCDEGTRERGRACDNPKPENGGLPCKGNATEKDVCRLQRCFKEPDDTNFEDGWGMWKQGTSDDFDWELRSGGTPTLRTGPDHDHTTGDGYYAYIEGSPPRWPNEVARLISKDFMPNYIEHCFTFYYMMNGKHIGYLDLSVKTKSNQMINLFRKNGHQGNDWINAAVNLPDLNESFSLVFEAQRGIGELSDIAIDDLYFDEHKCPPNEQGCQDHNPSCGDWAAIGECDLNKAWMKKHCCKSCYDKGSCQNKFEKCEFWAKRKQCQVNKGWMWKNCCRACRHCQNQHPNCESWGKTDECGRNQKWMAENCPASCKSCNLELEPTTN